MRLFVLLPIVTLLSGCAVGVVVVNDASRNETRAHTIRIMEKLRPDLNAEAAGKCIFDNMTRGEILRMGTSDVTGISQKHLDTVNAVIARPKTQNCLATAPAASA